MGWMKNISSHKIPVNIAEEPVECIYIGTGKALDYLDDLDSTNYGS